jgi:hypothetical protein
MKAFCVMAFFMGALIFGIGFGSAISGAAANNTGLMLAGAVIFAAGIFSIGVARFLEITETK